MAPTEPVTTTPPPTEDTVSTAFSGDVTVTTLLLNAVTTLLPGDTTTLPGDAATTESPIDASQDRASTAHLINGGYTAAVWLVAVWTLACQLH